MKFYAGMSALQGAAMLYQHETGSYPVTDAESTWYEKLKNTKYPPMLLLQETADGSLPLDLYGFPLIYELPTVAGELPVIRAPGPNGIDDGGALDDWDIRFGPNWGYWYKEQWTSDAWRMILWLILSIAVGVTVWFYVRPHRVALAIAFVLCACLFAILIPSHHLQPRLRMFVFPIVFPIGIGVYIGALVGMLALAVELIGMWVFRSPPDPGICRKCGYDLRGTIAANRSECPECGQRFVVRDSS